MHNEEQIKVSKELKQKIDEIRARCLIHGKKLPSRREVSEKIAKYLDVEKLWQNEYA